MEFHLIATGAYEVLWNEEKIFNHISKLVKEKKLSF